jgi:hypothetical protein
MLGKLSNVRCLGVGVGLGFGLGMFGFEVWKYAFLKYWFCVIWKSNF